jgi:Cys-tRNA synthase (O-phospho-L-seryl-tRNA:Cys-tRNA synthase)
MSGDPLTLIPLWQLILAGGVQIVTLVFWLATLSNRVKTLEKEQDKASPLIERVMKLEGLANRLERLEDKLDNVIENQLLRPIYNPKRSTHGPAE